MDRTARWERAAEWPLTLVALIFLIAYALPIAVPALPAWALNACEVAIWAAWAVFVVDYLTRLVLSGNRRRFVTSNLLDLAVVLLPMLRPLRLVRLLALVSILHRTALKELRGRVAVYTAGGAALLVLVGALAITDAERSEPGANITTLGDGLWWALATMTTVGYGDRFPVTTTGRFVAAGLMVGGIALLGVVTATIASWLVQRVSEVTESEEAATRAQVDLLAREVAGLRAELAAQADERRRLPGA
ncbi:MAG: ion channel [Propionicimonas sp.]|nr:ion channel [Propionicimonas sp.]